MIAAVTALATISIRIEMAILLGTTLSLGVYLQRTSHPSMRVMSFDKGVENGAGGGRSIGLASDRHFVVRADVPAPMPECPSARK